MTRLDLHQHREEVGDEDHLKAFASERCCQRLVRRAPSGGRGVRVRGTVLIFGTLSIASSEIFASELTLEGEMRLFDKIEEVAVPVVHFDERPPRYQIQI
jgi:hypothetical protein